LDLQISPGTWLFLCNITVSWVTGNSTATFVFTSDIAGSISPSLAYYSSGGNTTDNIFYSFVYSTSSQLAVGAVETISLYGTGGATLRNASTTFTAVQLS
jgi:hypothetical protein